MYKEVFKNYSQYYDLLYQDKDYSAESEFIHSLIQKFANNAKTILDLGCGTGKHDILLSEKGYDVTGVDLSETMLQVANKSAKSAESNNEFILGDVRTINLNKKYDVIISLFHVANYQNTNEDILNYFATAEKHLNKGGLFIFDFWYGPGVLTDFPTIREKIFENDDIMITRISKPEMFPNENIVKVNFEVTINDKKTKSITPINETHLMRYLFLPEIISFAADKHFSLLDSFEWMSDKELSFDSWNGVVILKKGC